MKKIICLMLITATYTCASSPEHPVNPFGAPSPMIQEHSPFKEQRMHEEAHPFGPSNPFSAPHTTEEEHPPFGSPFGSPTEHAAPTADEPMMHEPMMSAEHFHLRERHEESPFTEHRENESEPMMNNHEMHDMHKKEATHISTAVHDATLPTISVTAGHTHTFAPVSYEGTEATGYFIKDAAYTEYLSYTETKEGEKTVVTYTLTLPRSVASGTCVIFEGHGSLTQPTNLKPAFRLEIIGLPADHSNLQKPVSFKDQIKAAWEKQEAAEQKYFADIKSRFEALRTEIRTIWNDIQRENNESDTAKIDEKVITKEPLMLHVGEIKTIACSKGGSIQSSNPQAVSVKLIFNNATKKPSWDFVVTANEVGKSIISYTMDNVSYVQSVIVQKELTGTTTRHDREALSAEEKDKHTTLPEPATDSKKEEEISESRVEKLDSHDFDSGQHKVEVDKLPTPLTTSNETKEELLHDTSEAENTHTPEEINTEQHALPAEHEQEEIKTEELSPESHAKEFMEEHEEQLPVQENMHEEESPSEEREGA